MSSDLDNRIRDIAVWYLQNKNRIPKENLQKRIEFLEKACSCLIEAIAIAARDLMEQEQRKPHARLWLPSSVSLDDGSPPVQLR